MPSFESAWRIVLMKAVMLSTRADLAIDEHICAVLTDASTRADVRWWHHAVRGYTPAVTAMMRQKTIAWSRLMWFPWCAWSVVCSSQLLVSCIIVLITVELNQSHQASIIASAINCQLCWLLYHQLKSKLICMWCIVAGNDVMCLRMPLSSFKAGRTHCTVSMHSDAHSGAGVVSAAQCCSYISTFCCLQRSAPNAW